MQSARDTLFGTHGNRRDKDRHRCPQYNPACKRVHDEDSAYGHLSPRVVHEGEVSSKACVSKATVQTLSFAMYGSVEYDPEANGARYFQRSLRRNTSVVISILILADVLTSGLLPLFFLKAATYTKTWVWLCILAWAFSFAVLVTIAKIILTGSWTHAILISCHIVSGALCLTLVLITQVHPAGLVPLICTSVIFFVLSQYATIAAVRDKCLAYKRLSEND